jgi:tryptophan synthase alpha chain
MKNLVFYLTLHYPDRETFFQILELLDKEKAGYVEIGIPVSNPYIDGAVIGQTHKEVLEQKISSGDVIHTLEEIRSRFAFKVVLMTYKEGVEHFHLSDVPKDLYDGFLCVDGEYPTGAFPNQIAVLGQSLDGEGLAKALEHNELFAYVVSGEGKTGSFDKLPRSYIEVVKKVKSVSKIPAYVGFGIKSAEDVKEVMKNGADGAIIGTEFIKRYQAGGMDALNAYLKQLKKADA